jgi:SAM-dependent methyltransferase
MQFLDRLIGQQIRKPSGFLGSLLGHIMAADHKELTDWTLDQLQIKNNDFVLDIGCGSGLAIEKLNIIVTHGYIVGIDYSPTMLRQAAKRNRLVISKGKTMLCYGNVSTLPFTDASFDKVCAIETFYFWPNPSENPQEVKRIYFGEEMKALLCAAGFIHVSYKAIPEREKGWLCAVESGGITESCGWTDRESGVSLRF